MTLRNGENSQCGKQSNAHATQIYQRISDERPQRVSMFEKRYLRGLLKNY